MKKILTVICMLLVASFSFAGNGNSLLWKVTGNGLDKPTYLLGSHHLAPAEFIDSIPGLQMALNEVSAIYGEVTKDNLMSAESQQKMLTYAMAPADSTLSKLLTPSDLAKVDSILAIYTGMAGMTAQMDMLKPALVNQQIALFQIMKNFPQMQLGEAFDAAVMAVGEKQGKEIGGLESIDDQMILLLGGPLTKQAEELMETVNNIDLSLQQAIDLTNSYLQQDLNAVTKITFDPEYGVDPENLDRLIFNRNRKWVEELVELMPQKSMLVVVGCGHLGSDQGLIKLLENRGYTVEAVK